MFKLTERRTKHRVMAGTALALVVVVVVERLARAGGRAGETSARKDTPPTVSFWHVWTDEKGVSHQKRCEISAFNFQSISPGAAPSWIDKQSTPGATWWWLSYLWVGWASGMRTRNRNGSYRYPAGGSWKPWTASAWKWGRASCRSVGTRTPNRTPRDARDTAPARWAINPRDHARAT